jgi:phage shock protein G
MFGTIFVIPAESFSFFGEKTMLELLFVIGFFVMLLVTGVSLLGILAAIVVATALMFVGGLFALMIKLLPWLLLAVAVVWVIRAINRQKDNAYRAITAGVTKVLRGMSQPEQFCIQQRRHCLLNLSLLAR